MAPYSGCYGCAGGEPPTLLVHKAHTMPGRICVIGDGCEALACAMRLRLHGADAVDVTLLSTFAGADMVAQPTTATLSSGSGGNSSGSGGDTSSGGSNSGGSGSGSGGGDVISGWRAGMGASSVAGIFSRHGCPNLARWYDELHISLAIHDAPARMAAGPGGDPAPGDSRYQARVARAVMDLLAHECQHDCDHCPGVEVDGGGNDGDASNRNGGLGQEQELDGTLADFCSRFRLEGGRSGAAPRQQLRSWLVPLAACLWGLPLSSAETLSARLALRVLFENGLLLAGGDGSGGGEGSCAWWPLRPRGGAAAVHDRARAWLASHGVQLLSCNGAVPSVRLAGTPGGAVHVAYGTTRLSPFDSIVMAAAPADAEQMLRTELRGGGAEYTAARQWTAALHGLAECTLPLGLHVQRCTTASPSSSVLKPSASLAGEEAGCIVPPASDEEVVIYRPRFLPHCGFAVQPLTNNSSRSGTKGNSDAELLLCVRHISTAESLHQQPKSVQGALLGPGHEAAQTSVLRLQGMGGMWCASTLLEDGLQEGAIISALCVVRQLLPKHAVPLDVPAWRHRIHHRFVGRTDHKRLARARSPISHSFQYSVRYDYVNVDAGFRTWWGGLVREDHFGDPAIALGECVRRRVAEELGVWVAGPVDLLGSLREWGYCFNPICVYYCWASMQRRRLVCVVAMTTNTPWGQRASHVLPIDIGAAESHPLPSPCGYAGDNKDKPRPRRSVFQREKRLHVSPFNPPPDGEASWKYTITTPLPSLRRIDVGVTAYANAEQSNEAFQLAATLSLHRARPDLRGCGWIRGPYSLLVQFRIHWQAVLLLQKGATFNSNTTCPLASSYGAISHSTMVVVALVGFFSMAIATCGGVWMARVLTAA
jgi:DUF1365 family protein